MARTAPKLGGGSAALDATAFEARFNMPLVHEAVRAELNARRRGTASTKTRGEVSGGGAKPWRQKGTGRARAGSSRSPVWTGGGVVFGPTPRHYIGKVNKKARRAAFRSALSMHAERESLAVFDAGRFDTPSTKQAVALLAEWAAPGSTLVLITEAEAQAGLSFRNLRKVAVMPARDAGVADVIGAASLLVSESALPELVARAKSADAESAESADAAKSADADSVGDSADAESAKSAGADSVGDSAGAESPASARTGEAA
jgi:large subunit ribosomal protein L4